MRAGLRRKRLSWAILVATLIGATTSVPAFPDEGLRTPRSNDDFQKWGKDPFLHPPDPSSVEGESSASLVELRGVISGPSGVVAILNHHVVRVGDRVNGEIVADITPNAIVLRRGEQVRRVVIRSFALP